jgi:hypothetical protein
MKQFFASCQRALSVALRFVRAWLSIPVNACLAALVAVFLISILAWAIGDPYAEVALFFPAGRGSSLRGELRDLPRAHGAEAKAEIIASELLLGPRSPSLRAAFPQGTRLESAIYRNRKLYVDLSEDAALAEPATLRTGLRALEKSLRVSLPWLKRLTLTIGGREPYADAIMAGNGAKKQKNN